MRTQAVVLQVRKAGPALWVVTERNDDAPLQGPDRLGNPSTSFRTRADAVACANWRRSVDLHGPGATIEMGPAW